MANKKFPYPKNKVGRPSKERRTQELLSIVEDTVLRQQELINQLRKSREQDIKIWQLEMQLRENGERIHKLEFQHIMNNYSEWYQN